MSYSKKRALSRHAAATLLFRIQRHGGEICEVVKYFLKKYILCLISGIKHMWSRTVQLSDIFDYNNMDVWLRVEPWDAKAKFVSLHQDVFGLKTATIVW